MIAGLRQTGDLPINRQKRVINHAGYSSFGDDFRGRAARVNGNFWPAGRRWELKTTAGFVISECAWVLLDFVSYRLWRDQWGAVECAVVCNSRRVKKIV